MLIFICIISQKNEKSTSNLSNRGTFLKIFIALLSKNKIYMRFFAYAQNDKVSFRIQDTIQNDKVSFRIQDTIQNDKIPLRVAGKDKYVY